MNLESKHIRAKQNAWRLGCATWFIAGAVAWWIQAGAILDALLAVLVLLCVWIIVESFYWQGKRGKALERDLGFCHGTPYVRSNGRAVGVLTIQSATPSACSSRHASRPAISS